MMTLLKEYKGEQGRLQPSEFTIVPTYHSKRLGMLVDSIIIGISFLFFFSSNDRKGKKKLESFYLTLYNSACENS